MIENLGTETRGKFNQNLRIALYNKAIKHFGNDPNVEKIILAEDFNLPDIEKLDYSRFSAGTINKRSLKGIFKDLYHILYCPYIVDNFENNNDRDNWRQYLAYKDEKLFNVLLDSSLRPMSLTDIRNKISKLQRRGGIGKGDDWGIKFYETTDNIMDQLSDIGSYSRNFSKNEQIRFVQILHEKVVNLIIHIGTTLTK